MSRPLREYATHPLLYDWRMRRIRRRSADLVKQVTDAMASQPGRRLRVAFLMLENQKWSAQSVYDAMVLAPQFDPFVLVSTHVENVRGGSAVLRTTLEENAVFARERGMRVEYAYDSMAARFVPLDAFKPDVVFYEQPYGLPFEHSAGVVSRFALTCYIPYGYGIYLARESGQKKSAGFSEYIWRTFLESESFLEYSGHFDLLRDRSCVPVGYPKMDALRDGSSVLRSKEESEAEATPEVVFAPHHSITNDHHDSYGTFSWSGRWMLEMARANQDVRWIFKPHPKLKESLVSSGEMSTSEVDQHFLEWENLDNVETVHDGAYMDRFVRSDAMITDSGSFMLEYLLTGKPILLLRSRESAGYSPFGERIASLLYEARNTGAIETFLESVVRRGQDPRRRDREAAMPSINRNSGSDIASYLGALLAGHPKKTG